MNSKYSYLIFLLFFSLLIVVVYSLSPDGQRFVIDEAVYLRWGMLQEEIPANWIGMKIIPVWLIRQTIQYCGFGFGSLIILKMIFITFSIGFALFYYMWMNEKCKLPHQSILLTLLVISTPGILYVSGRLLSEIPTLMFFMGGVYFTSRLIQRQNDLSIENRISGYFAILTFFVLSYFSRNTIFTAIGAYLFYEILRSILSNSESFLHKIKIIAKTSVPFHLGIIFSLFVVVWSLNFQLPPFPLQNTSGHIEVTSHSSLKWSLIAFYGTPGIFPILAPFLILLTLTCKRMDKELFSAIMWFLFALSPFVYIWLKGGYLVPRYTIDIIIPLSYIVSLCLTKLENLGAEFKQRYLINSIGIFIILILWYFLHRFSNEFLTWYTHGFENLDRFLIWFTLYTLTSVFFISCWKAKSNLISISGFSFFLLITSIGFTSKSMGGDLTPTSPFYVRTILNKHIIPNESYIIMQSVNYEGSTILFTLPESKINFWDSNYNSLPGSREGFPEFFLQNRRSRIDSPDAKLKIREQYGEQIQFELLHESKFWQLYKVDS